MNREIKFRAWGVDLKIMCYYYPLSACGWSINGRNERPYEELAPLDRDGTEQFYKIMQFTGIRDKLGKDIYEGDIVYLSYSDGHERDSTYCYNGDYLVEFKDGAWILNRIHKNNDNKDLMDLVFESKRTNNEYSEFRIIGNIFENPKILE